MKRKWYILLCMFVLVSCKKLDFERVNKLSSSEVQINGTWVTAKSSIVDIDENGIVEYGHCWSLSKEPTISDNHSSHKSNFDKAEFLDTLLKLSPEQTYHIRPFVNTGNGIVYGDDHTFVAPKDITISCNKIQVTAEQTIATFSSITNVGSLQIDEYGTLISSQKNDMKNGVYRKKSVLQANDDFSESFKDLEKGKTYYVQAYAKLSNVTTMYSNVVEVVIPKLVINTGKCDILSSKTVQIYAEVQSLSFDAVTAYGFCWSATTSQPDFNSEHVIWNKNLTLGTISTQASDLQPSQTYYYRAFAMYGNTIVYSDIKTFRTK